jgi:putative endonuclease
MIEQQYYVYIMTNQDQTVLCTGVTNNLHRRVIEHKSGKGGVFSKKYKLHKLLYFETGDDISTAIMREKQIKGGSRQDKTDLINSINPTWEDLFEIYWKIIELPITRSIY